VRKRSLPSCYHSLERKKPGVPGLPLLLQPEFLDDRVVAALVILLEIAKVGATISNHLKKSAARMVILGVFLEVLGEFVDTATKKSDLDLRGSSVFLVAARVFDEGRLYSLR
jgi:hypothetical protein